MISESSAKPERAPENPPDKVTVEEVLPSKVFQCDAEIASVTVMVIASVSAVPIVIPPEPILSKFSPVACTVAVITPALAVARAFNCAISVLVVNAVLVTVNGASLSSVITA